MSRGTVKWFNPVKRYGFIKQENGQDIFFHASSILGDKSLEEGDRVTFQVEQGLKGPKAIAVRKVLEQEFNKTS
jgi:CspA family cold shock protein